jgi:hypothetical protein
MLGCKLINKTDKTMKKIFVLLMCSLVSSPLLASDKNDVSSLNEDWGNASDLYCQEHEIGGFSWDFCLHKENGCKEKKITGKDFDDEYSNYMWVATKVTNGGAYFCPMRIEARNKNAGRQVWTTYHYMSANDDFCVWLCKDGYGGADCSDSDGDFLCDSSHLTWNCNDKYKKVDEKGSSTNSEDSVAMFSRAQRDECGSNTDEEHDRILAVVGWMGDITNEKFNYTYEDGEGNEQTGEAKVIRGAIVRQMMVRTGHGWNGKDLVTWPKIYPATNSTEILLCKTGYRPDPISKKCVEINATRCAEQNICSGFQSGYDETMHKLQFYNNEGCYKYICAEEGKAFASANDRTCIDCPENLHGGSGEEGTCLKCTDNEIYVGKKCVSAKRLTKTELMYGIGKNRNSEKDLKQWCWTRSSIDEYGACVKGVSVEQYKCEKSGGAWNGRFCQPVTRASDTVAAVASRTTEDFK